MSDSLGHKRAGDLNLGWLPGSTVQPSKRRDIEGISSASIMNLQAQLYQAQESLQLGKDGLPSDHAHARRGGPLGVMERRNEGVEARDSRDRLQLKTAGDKATESYAALERKAALYNRLARGEGLGSDEEERYEVDFLAKGALQHSAATGRARAEDHWWISLQEESRTGPGGGTGSRQWAGPDVAGEVLGGTGGLMSEDMARERDQRQWEQSQRQRIAEADAEAERRRQHRETVMQVASETRAERDKAAEQKRSEEQQASDKVQRLKQEFLKKHAAKLLASKQQSQALKLTGKGSNAGGKAGT